MRFFSPLAMLTLAAITLGYDNLAAGPGPKGLSQVPLRVFIDPTDSTGVQMQTTGDLGTNVASEYVDGIDGVVAFINQTGGLTIDFQLDATSPRSVSFDYSYPVGLATAPPAGIPSYSGLRTHLTSNNVPLQSMAIPGSQCIPMGTAFGYTDGSYYRNSYHATNIVSINTTATAYGEVTRLDANTWRIESREGLCNSPALAHVAKLVKDPTGKGKATYTDQGAFVMGFSMRLIRK